MLGLIRLGCHDIFKCVSQLNVVPDFLKISDGFVNRSLAGT